MFELPGRLRVVERRRVAGKLELIHQLLSVGFLTLQQ